MNLRILSLLTIALLTFNSCETSEFEEVGLLVPLTVVEDPSLPSISINGILLHSEAFGNPADPMVVVIHCLLYTSPSPRDLSTSRMPSSA